MLNTWIRDAWPPVCALWLLVGLIVALRDLPHSIKTEAKIVTVMGFISLVILGPITLIPSDEHGHS